jgi:pectin methylesterase-like acyl-CoA thioesterase
MKRISTPNLYFGLFVSLLTATAAVADTNIWTGLGVDQNWSTGGNWTNATAGTSGTAPGAADDGRFFDSGATSPTVDAGFGGTIGSLWFVSTTTDYAASIAATLNVTGAGGLRVGTNGTAAAVRNLTISGGTLNVSNSSANLAVSAAAASGAGNKAILNLAGLDSFSADVNGLGIGSANYPSITGDRYSGDFYLARTNLVVLRYSQPLATYASTAAINALEMGHSPGNNPGIRNYLYLGVTNAFFADSLGIGKTKASTAAACTMQFNPSFLGDSPVAYFRGIGGDASRVTWWALGDMNNSASSAQVAYGTNDFTGGRVDALVETMSLGRDCVPNHTATGNQRYNIGVLIFENGTIDVNTLYVGNQVLGPGTSTTPNHGYIMVNGATATLIVNNNLVLARTTQSSTAAQQTFGRITVNGGTLRAHTISVGASSVTNAVLDVSTGGKLVLSNTLATATKPLRTLNLSDSTLVLHLNSAATVAYVTNLFTAGSANTINLASSVTFASYPAQIPLFKFVNFSNDVSGAGTHNVTLGTTPANVIGAYLTNNTFNSSLDLFIPTDPRPVITNQPTSFSGLVGSNVTFTVGATGLPVLSYQWRRDGTNISDGGNVSGTTTDTLAITGAQPSDNGNYTVVITNPYGSTTSAVAILDIGTGAPKISGPANQAVLEGNTVVFSSAVSGVPTPAIQWYKNASVLSGETSATLTIVNVQYPADQATYSIVATNANGQATNSATLTVLVPPAISTEPTSQTVAQGSPTALTVAATGNPAPTYQWSRNNTTIPNATNATLSFASAQPADAGGYAVFISNAGGSTNSVTVTLTVTSTTLGYTNALPLDNSTGLCYDTPLYLRFNTAPVLGAGTLRIYDSTDTLVDTIDLSLNQANNAQIRTIAGQAYYTYPVIIRSNTAAIFPHLGVLTSNTTYYVLMDTGFFKDAGGASMVGISSPTTWNFTTKVAGPDTSTVTNISVASDGSGDFVTVQGAIDWVLAGNTTPININLKKGVYEEINRIPAGKNNLTFMGEGCQESIITYANNNSFQLANAGTATRIMFYAGGNDCVFKNLIFTNSTPQGGSQAESIRAQGLRNLFDNCKFASYQDTILINSAASSSGYFNKCLVQGDVDFIWGSGIGYFQSCEIRALRRSANGTGVYTQARTAATTYGLIFADCLVTRETNDMTGWSLGRDANTSGPDGNVVWLNCRMDAHIGDFGWTDGGLADKSTLRFWENLSQNITGTGYVNTNSRVSWSKQLSLFDPSLPPQIRNLTNTFAPVSWVPMLPTYIACEPQHQNAYYGQTVTISASVGGTPEPVYQWYKGGTPIAGATSEDLVLPNVQAVDAATYSLRATNELGYAISANAVLSLFNPPSLGSPTVLGNGSVQFTFSGASGTGYRIWASTNAALSPITSTWTLVGSGTFTGSSVTFTDTQAASLGQRYYILTLP